MTHNNGPGGLGDLRGDGRTTLVVVHNWSTGLVEFLGSTAGPAGAAVADCGNGVTLSVDALDPTLIVSLQVDDPNNLLAARTIEELVGPEAAGTVIDLPTEPALLNIGQARTEAFTAAARLALFSWHLDMFPLPVDAALATIEEIVHRADLAATGVPIDDEVGRLDLPDLLAALHHHLTTIADRAPLPTVVTDGLAVAREYLDRDDPELADLARLVADHDTGAPSPAKPTPPARALLDAFGPVAEAREPAFAPGGDERRDSLEWHLPGVTPAGFDRTEDAIHTKAEGTYVRVTSTVDPEPLAGQAQTWAVIFDSATGALVGFAPGQTGTDPLGHIADDELTTTWTAVLTLPPGIELDDIYVAIRNDPRQPGEDEISRALGQPTRNAIRGKIYTDAAGTGDDLALETACRLLKEAIEGFVRVADRYRTIDAARAETAITSARLCQVDHQALLSELTGKRGGTLDPALALTRATSDRLAG